jgi:hypothetical protein
LATAFCMAAQAFRASGFLRTSCVFIG